MIVKFSSNSTLCVDGLQSSIPASFTDCNTDLSQEMFTYEKKKRPVFWFLQLQAENVG